MDNYKTLTNLTEDEARNAYKFIVQNRYKYNRREMAHQLEIKEGSIWGMMQRLKEAGFDIPRMARRSILKNPDFLKELRKLDEKIDKTIEE